MVDQLVDYSDGKFLTDRFQCEQLIISSIHTSGSGKRIFDKTPGDIESVISQEVKFLHSVLGESDLFQRFRRQLKVEVV